MLTQHSISTQQIHAVVLELRDALPGPDVRWSHFQQPLLIEDALGRKYPVPSEGDFGMLDALLRYKFREGPGSRQVRAGNYELCKTSRRSEVFTHTSRLLPGTAITMALILTVPAVYMDSADRCPMPRCQYLVSSPCPEGGRFV